MQVKKKQNWTRNNILVPNRERSTSRLYADVHTSPCLFNLCAEYIMRNARLEEAQAGIKIAGRNINNLRYADDTTLMAESKEELKSSVAQSCPTLRSHGTALHQASLSITNSWSLPKFLSIEPMMPSNYLILCRSLLPPSIFPSIRVFSNESALHVRWPKYWSFGFSTSEHPGLISFRMDWLDLLAVQGTLKSLLQHHSSKAILWCSAFFIVQLLHPYMATGKTMALTRWTFVGKGMSLLFNMLSRLVITFFPRTKRLLISWLQSPSAVILEPNKIKSATVSSSICHEVMGPDAMILGFWMLSFKPTFSLSSFTFIKRL